MKTRSFFLFIVFIFLNVITPMSYVFNGTNINYFLPNTVFAEEECTIVSAQWSPSGDQPDNFFIEYTTRANIIVKTKNCIANPGLYLTIVESDGYTDLTDDVWNDSGLYNINIVPPSDNFSIGIMLGEEDCESLAGGGVNYDCDLYFKIDQTNSSYSSFGKPGGEINYECTTLCDVEGKLLNILSLGNSDEPINLDPITEGEYKPGVYKLLAPIGNLTEAPEDIGSYFNTIFNIALGLCAVLAVIMIVIGGVQYMGDESIFGKTEAKSRITKAILGLLIALGSYALLNTINPDLLGGRGVSIKSVSGLIDPETEIAPWTGTSTVTGTTKTCLEGYTNVTTFGNPSTINVCKSISVGLQNLINKAKSEKIILSGSGSRTYDEQVYLRKQNGCKPNIYTSPSKDCSPPTARPGYSKHESGKAVDFNCNGQTMTASGGKNSVCFKWLSINAQNIAGLKNLASESWHWSDDGH